MASTFGSMSATPVHSLPSDLPLDPASVTASVPAGELSAATGSYKILLVDGNLHFVNSVKNVLRGLADVAVVGSAANRTQAWAMAEALCPDLVLLDFATPEMNGLEVAAQMQTWSVVPSFVFLSQSDDAAYREAAHRAGATGFVIKSNLVLDLIPLIERQVALKAMKGNRP